MIDDFSKHLAEAARAIASEPTPELTAAHAVKFATQEIPGCAAAGITVAASRKRLTTIASTGPDVDAADALQYELVEGPCVQAALEETLVQSPNIAEDVRWPRWGPVAAERFGMRSILSFQLFTLDDTVGAINLYGSTLDAFDVAARESVYLFASHIALLLDAAQTDEQRQSALASRLVIGQAQGILMERYGINPQQAFDVMRRVSQDRNVKVVQLAGTLVETGSLPGLTIQEPAD